MSPHRRAPLAVPLAAPCGAPAHPHRPHRPYVTGPHPQPAPPDALAGAVYEPEELAGLDPAEAGARIDALAPAQQVVQAAAYAAWLNEFGYGVTLAQILAAWGHDDKRAGRP